MWLLEFITVSLGIFAAYMGYDLYKISKKNGRILKDYPA